MRNDIVVGFSCCLIGSYNFWSFYIQNKLYMFNFSCYISTFLIGIIFLYRAWLYSKSANSINNPLSPFIQKTESTKKSIIEPIVLIEELTPDSKKYQKVSKYINTIIKGKGSKYSLTTIFLIKNESVKSKFKSYQAQISETCGCEGLQGPANTNYNFHGTKKLCNNGVCLGNNSKDCPLCNILKNGFKIKFAGKGASTDLRYGSGIYFSPDLNKALDYVNAQTPLLLMCKVVLGKVYLAKDNDSHLDEFNEKKFQSIYGDPRVTLELKQPEICVFKDEACLPKYLLEFKENM